MSSAQPALTTIMSGMRPTGKLHIGHYLGVLTNWLKLQEQYACYFMIADWHALTTRYDRSAELTEHTLQMLIDWLAVGIDPKKAVLYCQSDIPEIAQLHLIFSMLTPLPWVQGDPTLKDMVKQLHEDLNYGLLGYPVLQSADILIMQAEGVPVGRDQLAHLEITRDIARRFNHVTGSSVFPEARPLLTDTPLIAGLDGQKMGKSNNNAIFLSDTEDETWQKLRTALTDTGRVKRDDKGNPDNCPVVFPYYGLFADAATIATTDAECRQAARGCMDCKKGLAERINETLRPIRERGKTFAGDTAQLIQILRDGRKQARDRASETVLKVRQAMQWLPLVSS